MKLAILLFLAACCAAYAQDLRTDVTAGAFSPAYYTSVRPIFHLKAVGGGLQPNKTYTIHSLSGGSNIVQFHTDGSGNLTDAAGTQTITTGGPSSSGDLGGTSCTSSGSPDCPGVPINGFTSTNHMADFADDGSPTHVSASGGIGAVTCHRIFYDGSPGFTPPSPQPAATTQDIDVVYTIGTACSAGTTVTATITGANLNTNVCLAHLDVLIGSGGSGYLMHFYLGEGGTTTQSLTVPASLGTTLEGAPISAQLIQPAYAYNNLNQPGTLTVTGFSGTFHCGSSFSGTVNAAFVAQNEPTPTPTPGPTATAVPSATPVPSASATVTPAPFGSPTPATGTTPPPNVSVSNGGTKQDTVVDNPNDFYAPVKKAMEDAGRGMGAPGDGNGGGGAFGTGNGTHDNGDYSSRGHLDDLQGQITDAETARTSVVTGVTGKINALVASATSLGNQTFGSVNSITMNFNSIGNAAAVGHITLPTSLNLADWSGIISTLRLVLLWLLRIAFFVLLFRLCAAQGVKA